MYSVNAEVLNLFHSPATEKYDESWKVQLLGENVLKDGQIRKDMLTLSVPKNIYTNLSERIGQQVKLPIGFFVSDNRLTPFYPKNVSSESKKA